MYKRLTVAYCSLCSGTSSPMTILWEAERRDGEAARDDGLAIAAALVPLQEAYRKFCRDFPPPLWWLALETFAKDSVGEEKLTQQHDDVFKVLIVEPFKKECARIKKRKASDV
jgi:hypothetical protein